MWNREGGPADALLERPCASASNSYQAHTWLSNPIANRLERVETEKISRSDFYSHCFPNAIRSDVCNSRCNMYQMA